MKTRNRVQTTEYTMHGSSNTCIKCSGDRYISQDGGRTPVCLDHLNWLYNDNKVFREFNEETRIWTVIDKNAWEDSQLEDDVQNILFRLAYVVKNIEIINMIEDPFVFQSWKDLAYGAREMTKTQKNIGERWIKDNIAKINAGYFKEKED